MSKYISSALLLLSAVITAPAQVNTWKNNHGDQLAFDGVFYSYRSANALHSFKLWTPPQEEPIRGLLLFGNPGGGYGGDTRDKTMQQDLLHFATRKGIAIAGVNGFPGRQTYASLGQYILRGLESMGAHGKHPELAHIPFIVTGGSNAASFSYSMMCLAPERTIAITPNVGGYFDLNAPKETWGVPVWIHIGTTDPLSTSGVESTEQLFEINSTEGPLFWTWDAEIKGHENGGADHVDIPFWDEVLDIRLPDEMTRGHPVALNQLSYESGWCVDFDSWDHRITRAFPAKEHPKKELARYGWLPSEGLARLYQANATRSRPITLALADSSLISKREGTSGVYLSAGLTAMVDEGDSITINVSKDPLAFSIKTVGIYDKDVHLGDVNIEKGSAQFTFKAEQGKAYYALYAYEKVPSRFNPNAPPDERISAPLLVMVRDPAITQRINAQLAATTLAGKAVRRSIPPVTSSVIPDKAVAEESVLSAIRLPQGEAIARDGKLASLWSTLPGHRVDKRHLANADQHKPADTSALLKAAWDNSGLYLYFEVTDNDWNEQSDAAFNSIDLHIATINPDVLYIDGQPDLSCFTKPADTQLLSTAIQYTLAVSAADAGSKILINFWDPWDWRQEVWSTANRFSNTGVWYETIAIADNKRVIKFFLPWAFVGNPGFSKVPEAGTILAYLAGYHDDYSDSEASEIEAVRKFVWPHGIDPWHVGANETNPSAYGKLVLMP